ncbi:hypothetical protein IU433_30295 [Nocardia puris]|uniref:Uncharacterized protein n=1 Tax=Nocardia puris TaxID=208602 RepID=A0A366E4E4_9NOCA|nr:hypothetical protein [Nocardia puris]MBF6215465.1 hypothetical protein [Nocardia puris]MBF6369095.1 hypothetical protein [Nocardia puris]MBF6463296.1 hypothetical protein [Nocardia puris]RBO96669.1 hypothetical protein DFR74_101685 [Nocardia puris]
MKRSTTLLATAGIITAGTVALQLLGGAGTGGFDPFTDVSFGHVGQPFTPAGTGGLQ